VASTKRESNTFSHLEPPIDLDIAEAQWDCGLEEEQGNETCKKEAQRAMGNEI
jgi:hypothetical protein